MAIAKSAIQLTLNWNEYMHEWAGVMLFLLKLLVSFKKNLHIAYMFPVGFFFFGLQNRKKFLTLASDKVMHLTKKEKQVIGQTPRTSNWNWLLIIHLHSSYLRSFSLLSDFHILNLSPRQQQHFHIEQISCQIARSLCGTQVGAQSTEVRRSACS